METRFLLCALPAPYWATGELLQEQDRTLQETLADALLMERRIRKGVDADTERARYTQCCALFEGLVHARARVEVAPGDPSLESGDGEQLFGATLVGSGYLDFLADLFLDEGVSRPDPALRLGASCFPPGEEVGAIGRHLTGLQEYLAQRGQPTPDVVQERNAFLALAREAGCGVVEVQLPLSLSDAALSRSDREPSSTVAVAKVDIPAGRGKKHLKRVLRAQVAEALAGRGAILGDGAHHDVTTDVLASFLPVERDQPAGQVPVLYRDDSRAEDFPLRCVEPRPVAGERRILRAGLISMRHPEIDPLVDFNWFRNKVVSQRRAHAATDQLCYEQSHAHLEELAAAYSGQHLVLELYHTGLQPAVIGFYRALVERLVRDEQAWISVVPKYFRGGDRYVEGPTWTALRGD